MTIRAFLVSALFIAACGGSSPPAEEPGGGGPPPSAGPTQEELDAAVEAECHQRCDSEDGRTACLDDCRRAAATLGMECRVDCMPPVDGPCPPPGFALVCPDGQVTY